jgi:hypothetical protein
MFGAAANIKLHRPMTRAHKIEAWIAVIAPLVLASIALGVVHWIKQQPFSLRGAVIVEDADPRKQLPIAGVAVSAGDLAPETVNTDASGLFVLKLRKTIRKGHPMVVQFRHPQYRPFDLKDNVSNHLYVVRLTPWQNSDAKSDAGKTSDGESNNPKSNDPKNAAGNLPEVIVSNVRVRYSVGTMTELNVGSTAKMFEVQNQGNVPCKGQHPCSPDGKWKAATSEVSLDAGTGNEFRDVRASCIAGPCPFTRIDGVPPPQDSQRITISAHDWSDTATFVVEAEVFRQAVSQMVHWSYPIVFGDGLTFTLPSASTTVSIEADVGGQTIIFPLGPALHLSWANCESEVNSSKARVYRCSPKPGYRFQ